MSYPWSTLQKLTSAALNAAFAARIAEISALQTAVAALTPVEAKLQRTTVQSIPNNSNTPVQWSNPALLDTHGGWSSGAPSRWTCPSGCAGWYDYNGILSFANNATSTRAVHLLKNGSNVDGTQVILNGSASSSVLSMFFAGKVQLAVGDYIEVNAFQLSGGALNTGSGLTAPTLNLSRRLAA